MSDQAKAMMTETLAENVRLRDALASAERRAEEAERERDEWSANNMLVRKAANEDVDAAEARLRECEEALRGVARFAASSPFPEDDHQKGWAAICWCDDHEDAWRDKHTPECLAARRALSRLRKVSKP